MDVVQTVNITIDNADKQEQNQNQKQKQDVSTDDSPGNSVRPVVVTSSSKPVKSTKYLIGDSSPTILRKQYVKH